MAFDMKDYVEVADRIKDWYAKHPDGRITTEVIEFTDNRATVKAAVYRNGEDSPAGIGHSFLAIPGTTPYTKGSELENAETSAVGRALVFAGIPSKNVASAGEVRSKQAPQATTQANKSGVRTSPARPPSAGGGPAQPPPSGARSAGAGGTDTGKVGASKPPHSSENPWEGMGLD